MFEFLETPEKKVNNKNIEDYSLSFVDIALQMVIINIKFKNLMTIYTMPIVYDKCFIPLRHQIS